MKTLIRLIVVSSLALGAGTAALAAGEAVHLEPSGININNPESLQNGAKIFVNYCLSCHSANYMRYNRLAEDLGLSEELVMDNLVFADAKIGEPMTIAMDPEDSERWFGNTPPDLSLIGRARQADWLYAYMRSFYKDATGNWNNLALPNAAMPHVLWQWQGIQTPVYVSRDDHGRTVEVIDRLEVTTPGSMSPEAYDDAMRDLVAFLDYMGEPAKLKRKRIGVWVMLFLAVFALLAYLLKAEYWRDVH